MIWKPSPKAIQAAVEAYISDKGQFLKPPSMSIGPSLTLAPSAQVARGSQRLPSNRDL